jgi:GrpB-like predicted nucleotidyltransferase (UPF0157 family)
MIFIADYDAGWPQSFEFEKSRLLSVIAEYVECIEHIGSTSVRELAAKPIIDIMPGLKSADYLDLIVEPISSLGFNYISKYEDVMPYRRLLSRPQTEDKVGVNIHVVEHGREFWQRHIKFRDLLRSNEDVKNEYEKLKRALAPQFSNTNDYAGAKTEFIQAALDKHCSTP